MKAIISLSGGLDSTVILAMAKEKGRECHALSFDYGQRHRIELEHAKKVADYYRVPHTIIKLDRALFKGSSLVTQTDVPKNRTSEQIKTEGIPSTYVPARNTIFLSYALGMAEVEEADEVYYGSNKLDYYPYVDCRPEYFRAVQEVYNLATKRAVEGNPTQVIVPLVHMDKVEIIQEGIRLDVPFELTFTCYAPTAEGKACEQCDACLLREEGFALA